MNIQSAIIEGANILKNKSIQTAKLDTEILMAKAIGEDRKYIVLNNNKNLKEKNLKYFQKLINERSNRKPIAYLTNKKFFWNYEFFITKGGSASFSGSGSSVAQGRTDSTTKGIAYKIYGCGIYGGSDRMVVALESSVVLPRQ